MEIVMQGLRRVSKAVAAIQVKLWRKPVTERSRPAQQIATQWHKHKDILVASVLLLLSASPSFAQSASVTAAPPALILSQLLTLFTTPIVYVYLDRLQGLLRPDPASPAPLAEAAS
jgi:hypothetical protein